MPSIVSGSIIDVQYLRSLEPGALAASLLWDAANGEDGHGKLRRAVMAGRKLVDHATPALQYAGQVVPESVSSPAILLWEVEGDTWSGEDAPDPPDTLLCVDTNGRLVAGCDFEKGDMIITVAGMLLPVGESPPAEHHTSLTCTSADPYVMHVGDLSPCNFSRFISYDTRDAANVATVSMEQSGGSVLVVTATRAISAWEPLLLPPPTA